MKLRKKRGFGYFRGYNINSTVRLARYFVSINKAILQVSLSPRPYRQIPGWQRRTNGKSLKNTNSRYLSSLAMWMNYPGNYIGRNGVEVIKENEKFVMCSRSPQKLGLGHFTLPFSRGQKGNETKRKTHIQRSDFKAFLFPLPSSLLKYLFYA